MKAVLDDTFYWIALTNPGDSFHGGVLEFSRSLRPQSVVTTDEAAADVRQRAEQCALDDAEDGDIGADA